MQLASFGAGSGLKAAITRSELKEIKMREYSLMELFYLTRNELFALHADVVAEMAREPVRSAEYRIGLKNLRSIRRVLAQIRLTP